MIFAQNSSKCTKLPSTTGCSNKQFYVREAELKPASRAVSYILSINSTLSEGTNKPCNSADAFN